MEFHPFADVWPLLEGPKFDELVADIKAHGLRQVITVYQQKILDGRNRFRACVKAGVTPRYEPAKARNDQEALMLSTSLNKHRRHMSEDALAFVAEQLANIEHGLQARNIDHDIHKRMSSPENKPITMENAANAVGVPFRAVQSARAIATHAPDLKTKVLQGKRKGGMSMAAAANEAYDRARAKKAPPGKTTAEVLAINAAKRVNHTPRELTRLEVDPEFVGDEIAMVAEYGHVWMETSQERSTDRLTAWTISMRYLARILREQKLPKISPVVLSWLRKPKPADVESLQASLADLELAVAIARDLVERAQSAMAEKQRAAE